MANKIREIFSDDDITMGVHLKFKDNTVHQAFLSALKDVYRDGRTVPVDGISSITATKQHQGVEFPVKEYKSISHFIIAPSKEPIHIPIMVDNETINVTLLRWQTEKKIEVCSDSESVVYFHFTFARGEEKHKLSYTLQFEKAKTIADVVNSFRIAEAFLAKLYGTGRNESTERTDQMTISGVQAYFRLHTGLFSRLSAIEKELGLSILPERLTKMTSEERQDIDMLYSLLCEKKVVRLNGKLKSAKASTYFKNYGYNIGDRVLLTFLDSLEIKFLDQTVLLYTANLLVNAFIKDIVMEDDGEEKILYGDTDSRPMYIAYSGYKTKEEAKQEMDSIKDHIESYVDALTCNDYVGKIQ